MPGRISSRRPNGTGRISRGRPMLGATPSRIAMELADPLKVYVLAGVNLPMLLKAITLRRMPVHELVEQLVEAGHRAIRVIEPEQEVDPKARAAR